MTPLNSGARIIGKSLLVILLLLTTVYLLLVTINWQDAKPNADSLHMQKLLQQDAVADEQNGYQYLLAHHTNNELILSGPLQQLYHHCHQQDCAEALAAQTDLAKLIAEQHLLMAFYQQLLQYSQWQEPPPNHDELPRYQGLLHGQRLFLWQAWLDAQKGDNLQVSHALQADYQFWKNILAHNNSLIAKMISAAALKHHFNFAPKVIAQLPTKQRQAAVPAGWSDAFSEQELSLEQAMAGEWHLITNATLSIKQGQDPFSIGSSAGVLDTVLMQMASPLLLLEDTKNITASQLLQLDAPAIRPWYSWLRNPIGKLLMAVDARPLTGYQQRVQQLEPQRQAALQQME